MNKIDATGTVKKAKVYNHNFKDLLGCIKAFSAVCDSKTRKTL